MKTAKNFQEIMEAYINMHSESLEQIDELKSSTLKSYADKRMASFDRVKGIIPGSKEHKQWKMAQKAYDQAAAKRMVPSQAREEVEKVDEAIDKNNPIVKEYDSLKKNYNIKSLRDLIKTQSRIIDTSEFRNKDHAIFHYLRNKHGEKRVDDAFGIKEKNENLDESMKKVVENVSLWNGKKLKKSFRNQSEAESWVKKMKDEEDVRDYKMHAEELNLKEGTLVTKEGPKGLRPGALRTHTIEKSYKHSSGEIVYVVKQPNGFYGVVVTNKDKTAIVGSTYNNHDKETAHKIAQHYAKNKAVGMKDTWYHGSTDSIHSIKEEAEFEQIDEAIKIGTKVKIHTPGKHEHNKVGVVREIRHGLFKGAPKEYTVEYDYDKTTGNSQSIQLPKKNVKMYKESFVTENFKRGDIIEVPGSRNTEHKAVMLSSSTAVYLDDEYGDVEMVPSSAIKKSEKSKRVSRSERNLANEYLRNMKESKHFHSAMDNEYELLEKYDRIEKTRTQLAEQFARMTMERNFARSTGNPWTFRNEKEREYTRLKLQLEKLESDT